MSQKPKHTRDAKKPTGRKIPRGKEAEGEPTFSDTIAHGGQELELHIGSDQGGNKSPSSKAKAKPLERPQLAPGQPVQETDPPQGLTSPQLPKPLAVTLGENMSVLPAALKPLDVITVSSESAEEDDAPAGSTSPLFMQQCQQHSISDDADITITADSVTKVCQSLPKSSLADHHVSFGFTPPPSLQPHALTKHTSMRQAPAAGHSLPSSLREAFLSDEQPTISSSPVPDPKSSSPEEGLRPEEIWKHAVDDSSPPAIMHRIVTVSLFPRVW